MRVANDVLRFTLEMSMLAALAYAGFEIGEGAVGWVLGLGLPVLAATLWGIFLAPKSERRVGDPARLAMEVLIFGGAVAALLAAGHAEFAVVLGALVAGHLGLTFALGQR
jgi:hypothetical protein